MCACVREGGRAGGGITYQRKGHVEAIASNTRKEGVHSPQRNATHCDQALPKPPHCITRPSVLSLCPPIPPNLLASTIPRGAPEELDLPSSGVIEEPQQPQQVEHRVVNEGEPVRHSLLLIRLLMLLLVVVVGAETVRIQAVAATALSVARDTCIRSR